MKNLKSDNFNELYNKLVNYIVSNSDEYNSRTGKMYEVIGLSFELTNPENNLVYGDRGLNYEYAKEFLDFLLSFEPYVEDFDHGKFVKKYPWTKKFTDKETVPKGFSTAYGPKIETQLSRIIQLLTKTPETRRAVINITVPEDKIVWDLDTSHEYPCCNSIQFLIRGGKLNMLTQYRSNNIYKVLPYDVFLMTNLLILISNILEINKGSLFFHATSAHVFTSDIIK